MVNEDPISVVLLGSGGADIAPPDSLTIPHVRSTKEKILAKKPTGVKIPQSEIVRNVAHSLDVPEDSVQVVIANLQTEILGQLYQGNDVALGIGTFVRADKKAGFARNPRTGEQIETEAKSGARFKVGSRIKKFLNQ